MTLEYITEEERNHIVKTRYIAVEKTNHLSELIEKEWVCKVVSYLGGGGVTYEEDDITIQVGKDGSIMFIDGNFPCICKEFISVLEKAIALAKTMKSKEE